MRSTFRDWAAELTEYPRDLIEMAMAMAMAMAHVINSDVESTYPCGYEGSIKL